jgi:hypothetical protein
MPRVVNNIARIEAIQLDLGIGDADLLPHASGIKYDVRHAYY